MKKPKIMVSVRLKEKDIELLKKLADQLEMSQSEVVAYLMQEYDRTNNK